MNFKNFLTLGAVAVLALSSTVIAEENQVYVNNEKVGVQIESCIPLRPVAEALGYDVEWDSENKSVAILNLPQYVTMRIGIDGYTFAKTAPMPLGKAPFIKDGATYVPSELFSEILNYEVNSEKGNCYINEKAEENKSVINNVSVKEISESGILVEDAELGEVVLAIPEDTVISDENGNNVSAEDIKVNDSLTVEYGDAMTMSIPPINNPKSITIISANEELSTETTTDEIASETTTEESASETTTEE